tara:strand:- start:16161 stop:17084 length:924 start_codon:yes stop_codon:yes gene_type:complete
MTIRIAIVGLGKIARDQHLPAIAADAQFELVATVDPGAAPLDGVAHFADLDSLLEAELPVDAVALCTPPQIRAKLAKRAVAVGLHVMLEKPPTASVSQADALTALAQEGAPTLFAAWHSREAGAVEPARAWLAGKTLRQIAITWREDVRQWHPGQTWIWQPGGLGVFDPGINALSILTALLDEPVTLERANLQVPENCQAPIAAQLGLLAGEVPVSVDLDFLQTGKQTWEISVTTDDGVLRLEEGGSLLTQPGEKARVFADREYERLYRRFAKLIAAGQCEVDLRPFRLVSDAFLLGEVEQVVAFVE